MNIFQRIGKEYSSFGTCLLNDLDGKKMEIIHEDQSNVAKKANTIVVDWLAGMQSIKSCPYMSNIQS